MTQRKPKILIVDDEIFCHKVLRLILEEGSDILTEEAGVAGFNTALEHLPDLILLDADLPDISGFEVCRRLKADERSKNIPVLFLTGFDDLVFEAQAFDAGAVDYIVKPTSHYRVLMRVRAHLAPELAAQLKSPASSKYVDKTRSQ